MRNATKVAQLLLWFRFGFDHVLNMVLLLLFPLFICYWKARFYAVCVSIVTGLRQTSLFENCFLFYVLLVTLTFLCKEKIRENWHQFPGKFVIF